MKYFEQNSKRMVVE